MKLFQRPFSSETDKYQMSNPARQFTAENLHPPADYPYGERQSAVEDPAGHRWTFSQTIADVDPQTWGGILFED